MVSKIEGTCKAKVITCSWNEIEGQITPRKLIFYSKEHLFYCYKELRLKINFKKRKIWSETSATRKYCNDSQILLNKKFEQRTVKFSFFYGAGSDRILGNDKGVRVPVFKNHKIKTTNKWNMPEWPWEKGQHRIRCARLTLGFLPITVYSLSRNPKDQTGNNSHWT